MLELLKGEECLRIGLDYSYVSTFAVPLFRLSSLGIVYGYGKWLLGVL